MSGSGGGKRRDSIPDDDQNTHQHFSFSWYPRVDNLGSCVICSSNRCNQPFSALPGCYSLLIEVDERSKIWQKKNPINKSLLS